MLQHFASYVMSLERLEMSVKSYLHRPRAEALERLHIQIDRVAEARQELKASRSEKDDE